MRLWRSERTEAGRPLWLGAATFDVGVGLSGTTGQITHHIAPDIDAERDKLIGDLQRAGCLQSTQRLSRFHAVGRGTNGGGDPWRTDGDLLLGTLVRRADDHSSRPDGPQSPASATAG